MCRRSASIRRGTCGTAVSALGVTRFRRAAAYAQRRTGFPPIRTMRRWCGSLAILLVAAPITGLAAVTAHRINEAAFRCTGREWIPDNVLIEDEYLRSLTNEMASRSPGFRRRLGQIGDRMNFRETSRTTRLRLPVRPTDRPDEHCGEDTHVHVAFDPSGRTGVDQQDGRRHAALSVTTETRAVPLQKSRPGFSQCLFDVSRRAFNRRPASFARSRTYAARAAGRPGATAIHGARSTAGQHRLFD